MYCGMYVARDPQSSDLHHLIRENYRQVFFNKEILGIHLPFHLEREFKKYLTCGNLAFGMARFHCSLCQKDKLVAFSCKGRKLCPSCTGRRMSDTAKHLIEEVIPEVPTRQWVLSMPYAYRFYLARNPDFLRKALAIFQLPLKIGKVWDPPFREFVGKRCSYDDGFSLHANVKILAHQRAELERLCRYILRGPIAK